MPVPVTRVRRSSLPGEARGLVQASLGRRKHSLPSGDYLFLLVSLQARLKTRSPSQNLEKETGELGKRMGNMDITCIPRGRADQQDSLSGQPSGALNSLYIL